MSGERKKSSAEVGLISKALSTSIMGFVCCISRMNTVIGYFAKSPLQHPASRRTRLSRMVECWFQVEVAGMDHLTRHTEQVYTRAALAAAFWS